MIQLKMSNFPYFLVDRTKCLNNIEAIALKCKNQNIKLRPHFKTHQSVEVGELFKKFDVSSITVSSVDMANFFANNGWTDITIAFPVYPQMAKSINQLAASVKLGILFSSLKNLSKTYELITQKVDVYIEVDVGHGRSGVQTNNTREIAMMLSFIEQNKNLSFRGFLTHDGQTYKATSATEVARIYKRSMCQLGGLKQFWKESYPDLIVSYGDTPSASTIDDFWGIDELRAGNFVYYDLMQNRIGSCGIQSIAAALIAPVVDINSSRAEALIHAGAVHLSKEFIKNDDGSECFGLLCPFNASTQEWGKPFENVYVKSLSQEHGVVAFDSVNIPPFAVGDLVAVLPIHSCLTANLMRHCTQFVR